MARAVIIDDEQLLLATMARLLKRQGLDVIQANSFAEAEPHLHPGRFDVLITDIVMPGYDGMRVLHEVVEVRGCQEPVILITGAPNLDTASEAVRSGAFDYIQKPVTRDSLQDVVNRGLRHVRLLRERDEARQRELQLLKNLAKIGESASVLSHEIKTPITGLRHALSAVGDKLSVEDGVLIDEFADNLARIERLLGATLSFAKPLSLDRSSTRLCDVINDAVSASRIYELFAAMRVEVDVGEDLVADVDRQILSEVFENLLRNAADACGGDGQVHVSASRDAGGVYVDVQDDGPGISPDLRSEVFKPFRSFKDAGTGIGLAFARKVVEAHGASIDLKVSERGACFRVTIPSRLLADPGDLAG
ncbi:MAG: response regulator [Planctomycetota bacterium]|nr:response regulator [Planctomycetota bacterium]